LLPNLWKKNKPQATGDSAAAESKIIARFREETQQNSTGEHSRSLCRYSSPGVLYISYISFSFLLFFFFFGLSGEDWEEVSANRVDLIYLKPTKQNAKAGSERECEFIAVRS